MDNNKIPVLYGKTIDSVSYWNGIAKKVERKIVESHEVSNSVEAQQKFFDITAEIIKSGKAKDHISTTFYLNEKTNEVKRIEVSYIIEKAISVPVRKSKI
jgi:hypothetical protein